MQGYILTRLTPLQEDDNKGFDDLSKMIHNIDPGINLKKSSENVGSSLETFKQFYYNTFGKPGTPEFEKKLKEINKNNNK